MINTGRTENGPQDGDVVEDMDTGQHAGGQDLEDRGTGEKEDGEGSKEGLTKKTGDLGPVEVL